jgi:TonB family protein
MKSKLIFRHIKNNILKYTVTISAVVHLIGIFLFPSWGTAPDLVEEKIIKIKTVLKQPEKPIRKKLPEPKEIYKSVSSQPMKQSEAIIPKIRKKTARVRSVKVVEPSRAKKIIASSTHFPKQVSQPMKAVQQNSPTPHPSANLQKTAEMKILSTRPVSLRTKKINTILLASSTKLTERQVSDSFLKTNPINSHSPTRQIVRTTEITSPRPALERKHFTQVALVNNPQTRRTVSQNTQINSIKLQAKPIQTFSTARQNEIYSNLQPTRAIKDTIGNEIKKPFPFINSRAFQHLDRENSLAPTGVKDFTLMGDFTPALEIRERSPKNFDSNTSNPSQRAIPIFGNNAIPSLEKTSPLQLASIPSGFIEETINEKTIKENAETIEIPSSKKNISAGGTNEISADQMGKIKLAFSSQVRTKIAQTKYYPRMARKRGFEGEPVVAFTLGNSGDLLEITINNPSKHKLLDEAALEAVKSASPYPPIPELLKLKTLRFKLPISFILEEP